MVWATFWWETPSPGMNTDINLNHATYVDTPVDQVDLHGLGSPWRQRPLSAGMVWGTCQRSRCCPGLQIPPDLNPMWDVLEQEVCGAPPSNLQVIKYLLLTSWCKIPQGTFKGLVESMLQQIRVVLAAQRRPVPGLYAMNTGSKTGTLAVKCTWWCRRLCCCLTAKDLVMHWHRWTTMLAFLWQRPLCAGCLCVNSEEFFVCLSVRWSQDNFMTFKFAPMGNFDQMI